MQFLLPEFAENGGSFETSEVGKSIDDKLTSILEGDSRRFEISSFSTNDQRFFSAHIVKLYLSCTESA